ncbi:aspartate kinase [Dunaliella salina]|uniref:aspartate kinase n=1 Tax=Dunaliella salina TaxID=3046 RepID=A0ABQ7H3D1_DUNSA|nr:aspartate kinase [Dunaliella salina]|eukprot:KAF5841379.1 aspartate kinase [Dunaliella salina]
MQGLGLGIGGPSLLPSTSSHVKSNLPIPTVHTKKKSNGPLTKLSSGPDARHNPLTPLKPSFLNLVCTAAVTRQLTPPGSQADNLNVVYKFGGSSVRDAERMREVADIICSFPDLLPVVVLSAMGKTTNLLLECGVLALNVEAEKIQDLRPLQDLNKLHMDTCEELNVEPPVRAEVERLLGQLQQLLVGICLIQDLTPRAKDNLVSFGERMSTRIFASYLRTMGVPAQQYDSFKIGMVTSDDFTNADIVYDEALPQIKATFDARKNLREVPIVTGFLGRGQSSGAITTLGRGGSDLTATALGAALELGEVHVWKVGSFMNAPGTVISNARNMDDVLVTSIVLKNQVTLVDIISLRMMGQYGFLATVFDAFGKHKLSVDVVATSEVSVSVTLDPRKTENLDLELSMLKIDLGRIARVTSRNDLSIISLICNVQKTSKILQHTFEVLNDSGINVVMMSQGASKTNISLVVEGRDGQRAVQALHEKLFIRLKEAEGL